jgi:hypothetical protein
VCAGPAVVYILYVICSYRISNQVCTSCHSIPSNVTKTHNAIMNNCASMIASVGPQIAPLSGSFFVLFIIEVDLASKNTNPLYTYMRIRGCKCKLRDYVSSSPRRSANRARTSVTYCKASNMGTRWSRPLSVGSLIQPSIGTALSGSRC